MMSRSAATRNMHAIDVEDLGTCREIFVAGESRWFEREIELARVGLEVEESDAAEHLGVARERDSFRVGCRAHSRVELLQRGRESLEVGVVASGADVGVVGDEGGAVEHGREPADEHVLDTVPFEDGEQPLRIQRFRHGGCARRMRETLTLEASRCAGVIASAARIWSRSTPSSVGRSTRSGS